jgi:rRNA maturation endonuclease Nob1
MEIKYMCEGCSYKFKKTVADENEEVVCPICGKRQTHTRMVMEAGESGKLVPEKRHRWW